LVTTDLQAISKLVEVFSRVKWRLGAFGAFVGLAVWSPLCSPPIPGEGSSCWGPRNTRCYWRGIPTHIYAGSRGEVRLYICIFQGVCKGGLKRRRWAWLTLLWRTVACFGANNCDVLVAIVVVLVVLVASVVVAASIYFLLYYILYGLTKPQAT